MNKICKLCGKVFEKPYVTSKKEWGKRKFCSMPCYRANGRQDMVGEKNHSWRGIKVSYSGIHKWITKHKGKPKICTFCGSMTSKKFEWANIDHKYSRNLKDYISLCTSCHRIHDKNIIKN